jgi:hypothetical protein
VLVLALLEGAARVFFPHVLTHSVDERGVWTNMRLDPENAWKGLKPGFRGRIVSELFDVPVELGGQGFRPQLVLGESAAEPLQVLLLGDSFTFGWGIPYEQSYGIEMARELASLTRRRVVLTNLAIPDTGQWADLRWLSLADYPAPDVIVEGMYVMGHVGSGSDLLDNLNAERRERGRRAYGDASPDLGRSNEGVEWTRRVARWLKMNSQLYTVLEVRLGSFLLSKFAGAVQVERSSELIERGWEVTEAILDELRGEAEEREAALVLQYIPNQLDALQGNTSSFERLEEVAARVGIPLAPDPIPLLRNEDGEFYRNDFYYPIDGHWTARSHAIVGRALAAFLHEQVLDSHPEMPRPLD